MSNKDEELLESILRETEGRHAQRPVQQPAEQSREQYGAEPASASEPGGTFSDGTEQVQPAEQSAASAQQQESSQTQTEEPAEQAVSEAEALGLVAGSAALSGEPAELSSALALALGIGIQNIPEGAAVSLPLAGQGMSRMRAFLFGAFSGIVEPVFGLLVVLVLQTVMPVMPFMLAFAAGAMLYVVVEELIPESHAMAGGESDWATVSVLVGFLVMMVLDVALG